MRTRATTLAITAATGMLLLTGCGGSGNSGSSTPATTSKTHTSTPPQTGATSKSPASKGADAAAMIMIANFAFAGPASVSPGATVTVMNQDTQTHSVTSDDNLFTVDVQPGATATFTAPNKPGSYPYHCSFHSQMTATLTVK